MVTVSLVEHWGSPELVTHHLRELTWPKDLKETLGREPTVDETMKLLVERHYNSPLEHLGYTFLIEEMSMAMSREFLEHRLASHMGRSSRGFQATWAPSFEVPEPIRRNPDALAIFNRATQQSVAAFEELKQHVKQDSARLILPTASHCAYLWTINGSSLENFFGLRLCPRAFREIQQMAQDMLDLVLEVHPELWRHVGCRGVTAGLCPENEARKSVENLCPFYDPTSFDHIPTRDALGEMIPPRRLWKRVDWSQEPRR